MTNGEKIQTILDVDRDCTEVHGENGTMTFTVTQDFWNAEYKEPITKNNLGVDAVSREEVLDLIADYDLSMGQVVRGIHALPSVTLPEPRKGHWISTETKGVRYAFWCRYKCSLCGGLSDRTTFCPNCGARMVTPQESEDNNTSCQG